MSVGGVGFLCWDASPIDHSTRSRGCIYNRGRPNWNWGHCVHSRIRFRRRTILGCREALEECGGRGCGLEGDRGVRCGRRGEWFTRAGSPRNGVRPCGTSCWVDSERPDRSRTPAPCHLHERGVVELLLDRSGGLRPKCRRLDRIGRPSPTQPRRGPSIPLPQFRSESGCPPHLPGHFSIDDSRAVPGLTEVRFTRGSRRVAGPSRAPECAGFAPRLLRL